MSGFAKYTSKDNFRLKERPSYRRGQGADPIKSFVARSYATYSQNADRIRDARFAKSNELNRDYAVRNKREQMLSQLYMTERDPVKLQGLHSRLKMKLSRSDGALSNAMPYAYKTKFKPQTNPHSKPPSPKSPRNAHSSPNASQTTGAGFQTPQQSKPQRPSQSQQNNYGIPTGTVMERRAEWVRRRKNKYNS